MKITQRFLLIIIPAIFFIAAWGFGLSWLEYEKLETTVTEKAMDINALELVQLAKNPLFQYYSTDIRNGYLQDAHDQLKDIRFLFKETMADAALVQRYPMHIIFFNKDWKPIIEVAKRGTRHLNAKMTEHHKKHGEPFFSDYVDFTKPYSNLYKDIHKAVMPIGRDVNQDGQLTSDEVIGFVHSEYRLPLHEITQFINENLLINLFGVIIEILVLLILLFLLGRSLANPVSQLTHQVENIATHKEQVQPIRTDGNIKELNVLATTLNAMYKEIAEQQNALISARDEALAASSAKDEFLAVMSHEIRTPLNAVIGLTDVALHREPSGQSHGYLTKIATASRSLLHIINDVLDFSKIEAGMIQLEPVDFLLRNVVDHILDMYREQTYDKNIELIVSMCHECNYALHGDRMRLEQILINLMSNALKFTAEGEIELHIKTVEHTSNRALLKFSIRDTGQGLAQEEIERLFQPFEQADASTTRKYGGTGLGLSICKQLTEIMGGEIGVDSEPGKGSVFHFTIPFLWQQESSEIQLAMPDDLQILRTLVVDNNFTVQNALRTLLHAFTIESDTAKSSPDAITAIQHSLAIGAPYQLLIISWQLPNNSAKDMLREIKTLFGDKAAIPKIIALMPPCQENRTNQMDTNQEIDQFLCKPVTCSVLFDAIVMSFGKQIKRAYQQELEHLDFSNVIHQIGGNRILLVEDNTINQQVATAILSDVNIDADIAADGLQAVRMANEVDYAAILMDIQMPNLDGYEATHRIRKKGLFCETPIIAMTAHTMVSDQQACLGAGMNDHVSKPIMRKQFYQTLMKWLPTIQQAAPHQQSAPPIVASNLLDPPNSLPSIPGIDVASAIERVGDTPGFLPSLLIRFKEDNGNTIDDIRTSLTDAGNAAQLQSAARLIHTLKGIAGNLAANRVRNCALTLENAVKALETTHWSALLQELENALNEVFTSISTLEPAEDPTQTDCATTKTDIDIPVVTTLLQQLVVGINHYSYDTQKHMTAITPHLAGTVVADHAKRLAESLNHFNFTDAMTHVSDIAKILQISITATPPDNDQRIL